MNMAFWSRFPEMANRGVELRLIANHGEWNIARAKHSEWNIALDIGQWDSCGIWSSGPMPKLGNSISMTTHSRYGMIHPFAIDGRVDNRGYIAASYNKVYQIPLHEEVIDDCFMREYGSWLRECMQIYSSGAALAAHMPDLIPEHAVHPFIECLPLAATRDEVLENRTGCLDLLANSILWDTCGAQWGRSGHWPLLITYGTKRYRSEGMQQRRAATAEAQAEQ